MSSTRDISEALAPLINTRYLDDITIIRLSMTSKEMKECVTETLMDKMLTSGVLKSELLATVFLFPHLYTGENYNEEILKLILSYIGILTPKAVYDLELIESIINIIKHSSYENQAHYYSVTSNLAFFSNCEVLELFVDKKMPLPVRLDQKVKASLMMEINAGRADSASKFFQTYTYILEQKIVALFETILIRIKNHKPKLNGGGDSSIPEIAHPLPKQAAKIYKIIKSALESGESLLEEYKSLHELVLKKLSNTKMKGFLTSYGERDSSTTSLYSKIMGDLVKGSGLVNEWLGVEKELANLISPSKTLGDSI